ncbi:L-seryl-tRNA(Sec) selenium transferase [Luteibacter sp. UNC138MFCol5.1]|uniref:L-seryl-tRNA(Sec) selenium transferase n=1 Tax=Luteibacter sp. UNC138MFCol5.1 TaxID=1502774 RepID=UPI0008BB4EC1|nr:L-seryl-tRNA(Sec) selenium transferase [Luteibacter sp. UNC138MFCol5.1]SEO90971.1 L-seryl-tRNA(Sec) selenium transferase [Luteibacter sp. UNC138MFCol5.1]
MADPENVFRQLPAVATVLASPGAAALAGRHGRQATTNAIRDALADARKALQRQDGSALAGDWPPSAHDIVHAAARRLDTPPTLRPVINLTGTILHTNLGRALLPESAIEAAVDAMRHPVPLEYDLGTGARGERDDHVRALLRELTGADDATVVNNNAAAVLLCLNTFALRREAIVSRGELIEIGGAFRMPDIMARAGADMVEVGTTNRTHPADYRDALNERSGLILKVHTSNYRIQGFTSEVGARELAGIADEAGVPLLNDLGSGSLVDLSMQGLAREPTVREAVQEGARLVTFSGDKLLGGPQAGFIVGDRALIEQINRNPLKRALRVDKMRLAAIEATLRLYRDPDRLGEHLPTLRYLARTVGEIRAQATRLLPAVAARFGEAFHADIGDCQSQVGSGALPLDTLPSAALTIRAHGSQSALEALAARLRTGARPVIGRVADGALHFDLRCLADSDEPAFLATLAERSAEAP